MTVTVEVRIAHGEHDRSFTIIASDSALHDVRFKFNPSGLVNVDVLKCLAAALITKANEVGAANADAARSCATARTNAQQASFWAVHGATEGL